MTAKEVNLWLLAKGFHKIVGDLGKEANGIPGLQLDPIGYTCESRGYGFYRLKPRLEQGIVLVTKNDVRCGICKEPNCDHVRAVKQCRP